jgi:hypothetical protein
MELIQVPFCQSGQAMEFHPYLPTLVLRLVEVLVLSPVEAEPPTKVGASYT